VFSKGESPLTVDYIYTTTFLIVIAIPVSLNFYIWIPKFLRRENYVLYIISFIFNLVVFAGLASWLFQPLLDYLFQNYFFISYLSSTNIFFVFTIFLIVTTLLKLAEDWFYFNTNQNRLLRLQNQQIQTQLSALRSQINPHFLFNSLNVIYAMALQKQNTITSAIVELSDILRYIIYDSDTDLVSLKDEIKLINNYIAFQKHRVKSSNIVNLNIDVQNNDFKIYPMLLLPLLENAYKYGLSSKKDTTLITIQLIQNDKNFEFSISNSKENNNNDLDNTYSGVGLKTLRNNLNLVYPNRHQFIIDQTEQHFTVTIKIYAD
jgi:LytS/YehU family sensor histidine kinase